MLCKDDDGFEDFKRGHDYAVEKCVAYYESILNKGEKWKK